MLLASNQISCDRALNRLRVAVTSLKMRILNGSENLPALNKVGLHAPRQRSKAELEVRFFC